MPWEGTEEKKQKQGTNNARLAYVLHVYQPNYERMKTLLAYVKEIDLWQKHWGNASFTTEQRKGRRCTFPYHVAQGICKYADVANEPGGCIGDYIMQELEGNCK